MNMIAFGAAIGVLLNIVQICTTALSPCAIPPDYYWREYNGIIPLDAIQGGTDSNGNPTYVGQAFFRQYNGVLPVIIYRGSLYANATAHTYEVSTNKYIKILCTKYPANMRWIATKDGWSLPATDQLVLSGSEIGSNLYTGRVLHDGKLVTGKVFLPPITNSGLWIPHNNAPIRFTAYEILTYDMRWCYQYLK